MNITKVQRLTKDELSKFKSKYLAKWVSTHNHKIIDGFRKDGVDTLILSIGERKHENIPYAEISIWNKDKKTDDQTPAEFIRFNPSEFQQLLFLIARNADLITNEDGTALTNALSGFLNNEYSEEVNNQQPIT